MTRRLIRSLPEKGFPEDRLHPLFPLFTEDSILSPVNLAVSPVLPLIVKKMNYSGRSFTPGPECCNPFFCGRIPGCSWLFRKLFIPGKNSEFYFKELKKGDQGETDDTR
jgi:hypothetical protein